MKKFDLVQDQTIEFEGRKLYRIRALREFNNVKTGNIGGYVEYEHNLSHNGNCWLYDSAKSFQNAVVTENARMFGNSNIRDNSIMLGESIACNYTSLRDRSVMEGSSSIYENAVLSGLAHMYDSSTLHDNAHLCGLAWIGGHDSIGKDSVVSHPNHVFSVSHIGENYETITISHGKSGIIIVCGGFVGGAQEFIELSKQFRDNETVAEYAELIRIGSARVMRFINQYPHPI